MNKQKFEIKTNFESCSGSNIRLELDSVILEHKSIEKCPFCQESLKASRWDNKTTYLIHHKCSMISFERNILGYEIDSVIKFWNVEILKAKEYFLKELRISKRT